MLMYKKIKVIFLGYCVCLGCFSCCYATEAVKIDTELAVVIDVSGSMKQNDPHNLRIPALKLLINVLPDNVRTGIWLFDQNTSVLVPMGQVNTSWKRQALQSVNRIHSKGLFTNIEKALTAASAGWADQQLQVARHVLLLTDGMVDVAKDARQNLASKERILAELLPKLQQLGVHLQTIALSKNADNQLLKKLATATRGWNETVVSAEQLERIFFKMFKQSVPQPAVPLKQGNKFTIDNSIKEFSALVFRKPDGKTELITPKNQIFTQSTPTKSVEWVSEKNYDLMTVNEPEAGEWQIKAGMDPDNQVTIVTDLKFELDDLPKYQMKLAPIKFRAHFTDKGELLLRDDFLKLINVVVKISDGVNEYPDLQLLPDPKSKGYYAAQLDKPFQKGSYLLTIVADGKTFTREVNHTLEILDSPITLNTSIDSVKQQIKLTLIPDLKVINAESLTLQAQLNQIGHEIKTLNIPKHGDQWELTLDAPEKDTSLIINFIAKAKTLAGDEITPEIQPLVIDKNLIESEPKAAISSHNTETPPHAAVEPVATATQAGHENLQKETTEPEKEVNGSDWKMSALVVVIVNALLVVAAYFIYRFFKQRAVARQSQLLDRLS